MGEIEADKDEYERCEPFAPLREIKALGRRKKPNRKQKLLITPQLNNLTTISLEIAKYLLARDCDGWWGLIKG